MSSKDPVFKELKAYNLKAYNYTGPHGYLPSTPVTKQNDNDAPIPATNSYPFDKQSYRQESICSPTISSSHLHLPNDFQGHGKHRSFPYNPSSPKVVPIALRNNFLQVTGETLEWHPSLKKT